MSKSSKSVSIVIIIVVHLIFYSICIGKRVNFDSSGGNSSSSTTHADVDAEGFSTKLIDRVINKIGC